VRRGADFEAEWEMERAAFPGRVGLFRNLTPQEQGEVAGLFHEQRVEPDQLLFLEGDPAEYVYLVAEGKVKIVKQAAGGKEIILEVFGPGEVFGGATLLLPWHPASAVVMERGVILRLPRTEYHALLKRYPALAVEVIELLRQRLAEAHQIIRGLAAERVETRMARLLFKLAEKTGTPAADGLRLGVHLTRQDLADMVGCTLETAIRVLSRWQKEALIKTDEGLITILDRGGLQRVLEMAGGG